MGRPIIGVFGGWWFERPDGWLAPCIINIRRGVARRRMISLKHLKVKRDMKFNSSVLIQSDQTSTNEANAKQQHTESSLAPSCFFCYLFYLSVSAAGPFPLFLLPTCTSAHLSLPYPCPVHLSVPLICVFPAPAASRSQLVQFCVVCPMRYKLR